MTVNEDLRELEELLAARAYLYAAFHNVFCGPMTAELLDRWISSATLDALEPFAAENPALSAFRIFLEELDVERALEGAPSEYVRMFVGPGAPESPCWGALYMGGEPCLFQEETLAVRRCYQQAGWQTARFHRIDETHVALEAQFMAFESAQALKALEEHHLEDFVRAMRNQLQFLQKHLAPWLPRFVETAHLAKGGVLYPWMVHAFAEFVDIDRVFCGEAIAYGEEGLSRVVDSALPGALAPDLPLWKSCRLPFSDDNWLVAIE